jgi:hypothetical protein
MPLSNVLSFSFGGDDDTAPITDEMIANISRMLAGRDPAGDPRGILRAGILRQSEDSDSDHERAHPQ